MYVRFVVLSKDKDSHRLQGIFQAAAKLRDRDVLSQKDADALEYLWKWFDRKLDGPARLSRSRRPRAHKNAISWFRDTASEHIANMREMMSILEEYGIQTEMLQTDRPGYIVFEDEHQIAAVPFKDTAA